ncbi:Uncharacterised protein [uncultured archaeon]|nr:Uncharacterised protein [uncultured archaeon]
MQENKEFEEWKENHVILGTNEVISKIDDKPMLRDIDVLQVGYEAGQQSERDKHRWIPVTERLPTENDGKPEYEGDERYTRIIVHIKNIMVKNGIE